MKVGFLTVHNSAKVAAIKGIKQLGSVLSGERGETENTKVKRKQSVESSSENELCDASIFLVIKATQILLNWHTVNKKKNKESRF